MDEHGPYAGLHDAAGRLLMLGAEADGDGLLGIINRERDSVTHLGGGFARFREVMPSGAAQVSESL